MDLPLLILELSNSTGEGYLQPFAGGMLWCDEPLEPSAMRAAHPAMAEVLEGASWKLVYDGPGLVDGGIRRVRSTVAPDGARQVEFEDGERFWIAPDGRRIQRTGAASGRARSLERGLGAPVALALAQQGTFLLHASALAGSRGVIALAAPSGGGKSTLAAAAERDAAVHGLARIADDLLPVRLRSRPVALPHFPQLKLPAQSGYPSAAPAEVPLLALVELERSDGQAEVTLERLTQAEACLALVRATVAARLLDGAGLERHFAACAEASSALEVLRLHYPNGLDRLREPLFALGAHFGALQPS